MPTPDSPRMATNSPAATDRSTPLNTGLSPCRLAELPDVRAWAAAAGQSTCASAVRSSRLRNRCSAATACGSASSASQATTSRCGMLRSQVSCRLASCRVAARARSRNRAGRCAVEQAIACRVEGLPDLAVADAAHRRQRGVEVTARAQTERTSSDQAVGEHLIETLPRCAGAASFDRAAPAKSTAGGRVAARHLRCAGGTRPAACR